MKIVVHPMADPIEGGVRDLIHQLREFLVALQLSQGDTALHFL